MAGSLSRVEELEEEPSSRRLLLCSIDRSARADIALANGAFVARTDVIRTFDDLAIPDGTPFVVDAEGSFDHVETLNTYLREAARQRAYKPATLLNSHARPLINFLRHVRLRDPHADLVDATREDLVSYRDQRVAVVAPGTWNNELSSISNFFHYAMERRWIQTDPIPRWGASGRITIKESISHTRRVRFLTEIQARQFLEVGLRGDGAPEDGFPGYPERDYALGLTLVSTGLRRAEAALLLDAEIPSEVHPSGVHTFWRTGKGEYAREIWITDVLAAVIHSYRRTEREFVVQRAQRNLRAALRAGDLTIADGLVPGRNGALTVVIGGIARPIERIPDDLRTTLVKVRDDGVIEPLALFLVQGGRPPAVRTVNHLFVEAGIRNALHGKRVNLPPTHLDVTPHVMRHTFAVRTLAALMRHGRAEAGDPYTFLASPLLVVQALLGHADLATTMRYLYLAERYSDQVPDSLRAAVAGLTARI